MRGGLCDILCQRPYCFNIVSMRLCRTGSARVANNNSFPLCALTDGSKGGLNLIETLKRGTQKMKYGALLHITHQQGAHSTKTLYEKKKYRSNTVAVALNNNMLTGRTLQGFRPHGTKKMQTRMAVVRLKMYSRYFRNICICTYVKLSKINLSRVNSCTNATIKIMILTHF